MAGAQVAAHHHPEVLLGGAAPRPGSPQPALKPGAVPGAARCICPFRISQGFCHPIPLACSWQPCPCDWTDWLSWCGVTCTPNESMLYHFSQGTDRGADEERSQCSRPLHYHSYWPPGEAGPIMPLRLIIRPAFICPSRP